MKKHKTSRKNQKDTKSTGTITKTSPNQPISDSDGFGKQPQKKHKSKARVSHSQEELDARRKQVYDLVLMGEAQSSIAKRFGVDVRTIEKDISVVRAEVGKQLTLGNMLSVTADFEEGAKKRISRLWRVILEGKASNDEIIRAIKELREEDKESIKRRQMVGVLPKEVSALVNVESNSKEGVAENKVMINIIAPGQIKKEKEGDE